jgi:putative membrane protein
MTKDADGIWRGQAEKDGKTTSVAVDYKGNVVAN